MADHDHTDPPSDPALRVKALESLLVEMGVIDPEVVGAFADYYEHRVGPRNGARVVAHAEAFSLAVALHRQAWPAGRVEAGLRR